MNPLWGQMGDHNELKTSYYRVGLAIVSGLSWFLTGRGSLQAHSQPMDHPPMAREVPQQRAD